MKRKAFTLIELLVVIGILILLVGIMFPAIERAKEAIKRNAAKSTLAAIGTAIERYKVDFKAYPTSKNFYNKITGWMYGPRADEDWGFRTQSKRMCGPYIDDPGKMDVWKDDTGEVVETANHERYFADVWNNPIFYGRILRTSNGTKSYVAVNPSQGDHSLADFKDMDGRTITYLNEAAKQRNDFILCSAGSNNAWGFFRYNQWGDGEYDSTEGRYEMTFNDITNFKD